jgi:hypothetical protein
MKGKEFKRSFGVDLDTKNESTIKFYTARMMFIGQIIQKYPTKKGWHFRVKPSKDLTFIGYITMREFCGDDCRRIVRDVIRYHQGLSYDHLFYKKRKGWVGLNELHKRTFEDIQAQNDQ